MTDPLKHKSNHTMSNDPQGIEEKLRKLCCNLDARAAGGAAGGASTNDLRLFLSS